MKCIIIDDEPIARKGMKRLVETRRELELAAMFDNAAEAKEWLAANSTDLIFLDIEMPGLNGIDFARNIPVKCMIVFTTAYSDYAIEGFEVEALDYLVKPIDPERFNNAVDRAVAYKRLIDETESNDAKPSDTEFMTVKADRKYVRVRMDDILYVEGLKDYVIIHLPSRNIVTRMTIKVMEETLPRPRFLRVNKSYIVNSDKIDAFDNNDVTIGATDISIGMSYRDSVINALLNHIR